MRERYAEIEQRASEATPGPWSAYDDDPEHGRLYRYGDFGWTVSGPAGGVEVEDSEQGRADAAFIAHARKDVPFLLQQVERLEGELIAARNRVSALKANGAELLTRAERAEAAAAEAEHDRDALRKQLHASNVDAAGGENALLKRVEVAEAELRRCGRALCGDVERDRDHYEAELARIVADIEAEREKTRDNDGATLRDEHVIKGVLNGLGIALKIARGE